MLKIKIMGERSTGTHLLEKVLAENFDCEILPSSSGVSEEQKMALPGSLEGRWASRRASREAIQDHNHYVELPSNGGWKHAALTQRFCKEFALIHTPIVLCVVRHPADWLRSMHRNPFHGIGHVPRKFSEFIRAPWIAAARDELGERLLSSPLTLLERKAASYAAFREQYESIFIIRYEDLILNPMEMFENLPLWESRRNDQIVLPDQSARSFGRGNLATTGYIEKANAASFATLEAEDRKFVSATLDGGILSAFYAS